MGPPITKRPVGFIRIRTSLAGRSKEAKTGSITNFLISGAIFFSISISGAC